MLGENRDVSSNTTRNGSGKTTISNAIAYAIYGQTIHPIKKDNLINLVNKKNMLVTLEFEKDGVLYRIERGRKPTVFKFYINGIEHTFDVSQGDSRETQKDLTAYIGMNVELFKHIILLTTYTEPFLFMNSSNQRLMIEQLLGITQLSEKADVLRSQIKSTKESIIHETATIQALQRSNAAIQSNIDSLKKRQREWNRSRDADINSIINSLTDLQAIDIDKELDSHAALRIYNENVSKKTEIAKSLRLYTESKNQRQSKLDSLLNQIVALESGVCYACGQPLKDHTHDIKHAQLINDIATETAALENYSLEIDQLSTRYAECEILDKKPDTFYSSLDRALEHKTNLSVLESQLELKLSETDPYLAQIQSLESSALQDIDWSTVNQLTALQEHQEFLLKLLTNKDSFIRKRIIDQNLLYLNHRLAYYLDQIGLPHGVKFLNDLSVEIQLLGQNLDVYNLSRGEMNRLIISLSFAFRDVWENLYHPVNLLFIDEMLDSGLDTSGVENSLGLLKHMSTERNKNIFLISHREELVGRVNTVLTAVKENNFTSFAIE